jgi:hypothetical protein
MLSIFEWQTVWDIEMVFHPLKTFLRKAAERTIEGLQRRVRSYIRALDPSECVSYFTHAGYEPVMTATCCSIAIVVYVGDATQPKNQ